MSVTITYAPLGEWPRTPTAERGSGSGFRATLAATVELLVYELDWIEAKNPVLRVDVGLHQISRDGRKLLARPAQPGVVLEFDKPTRLANGTSSTAHGLLAVDRYWTWEANLRGIALTLQALRAVDRHGATASDEQYRGFLALPGAGGVNTTAVQLTPERAARIFADEAAGERGSQMIRDAAARQFLADPLSLGEVDLLWRRSHPDASRDDTSGTFTTLTEARRVLYRHHGRSLTGGSA